MKNYALPGSILGLAVAIAYLGYALLTFTLALPASLDKIENTAKSIALLEDEIAMIIEQVPNIIQEVEQVRTLVPDVLKESAMIRADTLLVQKEMQAYRLVLPSILDESASVRKDILVVEQEMEAYRDMLPKIMAETAEVRKQVDSLQIELAAYRLTIPEILQEVEATREMIPPMLDRVDNMIADASDAGKRASEGAVAGVFSGVFKAPLSVFTSVLPKKHSADAPYVTEAAMKIINDEDLDGFVTFNNRYTGTQGSVTLVESLIIDGKDCRSLSIHAERSGKTTYDRMINLCLTASGDWVQIDTRKK
tara:strand:+ start:9800 stop:10723 length:924 start_codon:yes stop_codon:yes gene_type:complete